MKYLPSSFKHGITREQMDEVIGIGIPFELETSMAGQEQVMYVGWDYNANLLEVAVAYPENEEEFVFHARRASKKYRDRITL